MSVNVAVEVDDAVSGIPTARECSWSIVAHRGLDGLRRLEADWHRLLEAMPDRAWYHTFETHAGYFSALHEAQGSFTCLALSDGRSVRAILPLEWRTVSPLGFPMPALGMACDPHNPLRDVICPPGEARQRLLPEVIRHLRSSPGTPQWIIFDRILQRSAAWECLAGIDARLRVTDAVEACDSLNCNQAFEKLFAGLSKHFRHNIRNAGRKLDTLDRVEFVNATDAEAVHREFDAFLEIEAAGWKGEHGTAVQLDPALTRFHRVLSSMGGDAARFEVNALHAEGRCIASQFCVRAGEEYTIVKVAYDEEYARFAPGQLLLHRTLERCCADPEIRRVSLVTHSRWAQDWRPEVEVVQRVHVGVGRVSGPLAARLLRLRFSKGPLVKRILNGVHSILAE